MQNSAPTTSNIPKVVIATTVALSFISFWRAAAIVLADMASSMFYVGGIAEQAVGRAAPWFVLAVMLFSFAVRAVYLESCSMFVRGGVYVVVRNTLGPILAKISVSALVFDYLLTGPISGVSAGHYIGGLINETSAQFGLGVRVDRDLFAVLTALAVTSYFWWCNVKGLQESSRKALRILQITSVMVVVTLAWSAITIAVRGEVQLPPAPVPENLHFTGESLGWFKGTLLPSIGAVSIMIAFGHAFLSMSGFETLTQVYREIAFPKMKNLVKAGNIVCFYALISTGLITVLAGIIIPEASRLHYLDNLIGGLAMNFEGPTLLRLLFHAFVVVVGGLILSGAVNTSMIGANAVMNRVAEDGVLLSWFRKPHRRFGTTFRIINLIALLQIITIVMSRGDVYLLGEAYAFGVIWSFVLESVGVLVLRFKRKDQEYRVPLNFRIAGREIPFGLLAITSALIFIACTNLVSKQVATIYGVSFTAFFFVLFTLSERINLRTRSKRNAGLEEFNLDHQEDIAPETISLPPGGTLVAVRDYNALAQLQWALDIKKGKTSNIVVMTVRTVSPREGDLNREQYFATYEKRLFTKVVQMAEKAGRHVDLLVVPGGSGPFDAMVQTAAKLRCTLLVTGASPRMNTEELARKIGLAWERLPEPRHPFSLVVVGQHKAPFYTSLGPHAPQLWPEDIQRVHDLWLEFSQDKQLGAKLHHRDVVSLALKRLSRDIESDQYQKIIEEFVQELRKN